MTELSKRGERLRNVMALVLVVGTCATGAEAIEPVLKLKRGAANAALGWIALPKAIVRCPVDWGVDDFESFLGPFNYVFCGVAGLAEGTAREVIGIAETATFFLPWPEDPYLFMMTDYPLDD